MRASIKRLTKLLSGNKAEAPNNQESELTITAAAILLQIMAADGQVSDSEKTTVRHMLLTEFNINASEIAELLDQANQRKDDTYDVFTLTRQLNDNWSENERALLLQQMYKLASADGHIDDLEQHMISKIAKLLYIPRNLHVAAKRNTLKAI